MYQRKPKTITDLKEAIREEMRAISRSVCKNVMNNFVPRLKKCTNLNSCHLEKILLSTQEQAGHYHALALCLEDNKVVMSVFPFNLNGNFRNDAHRKLGLVFWVTLYINILQSKPKRVYLVCVSLD